MKFACCTELFTEVPIGELYAIIRQCGYNGVEIAPESIFADPEQPTDSEIRAVRSALRDSDLALAGFHWVLRKPSRLNLLSDDFATRERSWDLLCWLTTVLEELGGAVMVIGSGNQRRRVGMSHHAAMRLLRDELRQLCDRTAECSVVYCLEPLPPSRSNVLNTLREVDETVRAVGRNRVQAVFDFRNAGYETAGWTDLIRTHRDIIRHVHVSEPDGTHPSVHSRHFVRPLTELSGDLYGGWVSAEPLRITKPPREAIAEMISCLRCGGA